MLESAISFSVDFNVSGFLRIHHIPEILASLRTKYLNAAICKSSFPPPSEKDFEVDICDPIGHIVRTDLRNSKLRERTIERAFVLRLLERGGYPIDGKSEKIDWLRAGAVEELRRFLSM